jgi:hypothetical protein
MYVNLKIHLDIFIFSISIFDRQGMYLPYRWRYYETWTYVKEVSVGRCRVVFSLSYVHAHAVICAGIVTCSRIRPYLAYVHTCIVAWSVNPSIHPSPACLHLLGRRGRWNRPSRRRGGWYGVQHVLPPVLFTLCITRFLSSQTLQSLIKFIFKSINIYNTKDVYYETTFHNESDNTNLALWLLI